MPARATLVALMAALLLPAAASAATTVGSTLPPWTGDTLECDNLDGCTFVPRTISGRVIAMPYDGVIVRWSARMPAAADTTTLVFKPLRVTAIGATPSGGSLPMNPATTTGAVATRTARIAVNAGDLIAIDLDDGDEIGISPHALLDSGSWTFFPPLMSDRAPDSTDNDNFEMAFNATVERDADRDGFGDESQDNCPQLASEWFRTCRGRPVISVAAGRAGIGLVGVGGHIPIDATIRGDQQIVAGARLELTLPDGLEPVELTGTAFCTISGQRVICPAGKLEPRKGLVLHLDALARRPTVGQVQALGTNLFGDAVTAADAIRITTQKRCGLRIPAGPGSDRGTNGGDRITGTRSDDELVARAGDDCLTGGRGNDLLRGNAGDDRLTGGPGRDRLEGGPGDDAIEAVDGKRDLVRCGPGRDRAHVDKHDSVSNCERVRGGR